MKKKNHRKQPKVILLFSAYMANLTFLNQMFHIHSLEAKNHINLKKILQFLLRALNEKKNRNRFDIVFLLWSVCVEVVNQENCTNKKNVHCSIYHLKSRSWNIICTYILIHFSKIRGLCFDEINHQAKLFKIIFFLLTEYPGQCWT